MDDEASDHQYQRDRHNGSEAGMKPRNRHERDERELLDTCLDDGRVASTSITITSLPLELLERVFECVRLIIQDRDTKNDEGWRTILHLTHVCHLWREVAIVSPYLWTEVSPSAPLQYSELVIRRSRNVFSVNSRGDCPFVRHEQLVDLLLPEMHRI